MGGEEITFSLVTKSISPQNRFSMDITQKCPKGDLWHLLGARAWQWFGQVEDEVKILTK